MIVYLVEKGELNVRALFDHGDDMFIMIVNWLHWNNFNHLSVVIAFSFGSNCSVVQ